MNSISSNPEYNPQIRVSMPKTIEPLLSREGWVAYRQNIEVYELLFHFISSYRQGLKALTGFNNKNLPKEVITTKYDFDTVELTVRSFTTRRISHKELFEIIDQHLNFGLLHLKYYGNTGIKSFRKYRNRYRVSLNSIISIYKEWYLKSFSQKELKQEILKPKLNTTLEELIHRELENNSLSLNIDISTINKLLDLASEQRTNELETVIALLANDYITALELSKAYANKIKEFEDTVNMVMGVKNIDPDQLKHKITKTISLEGMTIVRHIVPTKTIEWSSISKTLFGYVKPSKREKSKQIDLELEQVQISGEIGALLEKPETLSRKILRLYKPRDFNNERFIMVDGLRKRIKELIEANINNGLRFSSLYAF